MLHSILIQIVLPVSVLALVAWAWSKRNTAPDVPIDVPRSDNGPRATGDKERVVNFGTGDEERVRIERMLDEELLPRGFTMHPSPNTRTYTRTFQYSKGDLVLNVTRFASHDGDNFWCDTVTDGATRVVAGFGKYGPARSLTEEQLAEFQRDLGAFLDAEGA